MPDGQEKGDVRMSKIKKGGIYWAELSPVVGSEQYGLRPILVIQNDIANQYGPTVIVCVVTKQHKGKYPTQVELKKAKYPGLINDSVAMLEQIRTLDKERIMDKMDHLDEEDMDKVEKAILTSFNIDVESLKGIR